MSKQNYRPDLDFLRVLSVQFGIPFHAFIMAIPVYDLLWWKSDFSVPLHWINWSTHLLRMQLFMFLAGYFARVMLQKKGAFGFALDRLRRILIPFMVGYFTILPLSLIAFIQGHQILLNRELAPLPVLSSHLFGIAWSAQARLGYLWFLAYLIALYLPVLLIAMTPLRSITGALGSWLGRRSVFFIALLLWIAAFFCTNNSDHWTDIGVPPSTYYPDLLQLGYYGAFFLLGMLYCHSSEKQAEVSRSTPVFLTVGGLGMIGLTWFCLQNPEQAGLPGTQTLDLTLRAVQHTSGVSLFLGLLGVAHRYFNTRSELIFRLAQGSYWTYFIHYPIVTWMSFALLAAGWGRGVAFAVAIGTIPFLCHLSYHAIFQAGREPR